MSFREDDRSEKHRRIGEGKRAGTVLETPALLWLARKRTTRRRHVAPCFVLLDATSDGGSAKAGVACATARAATIGATTSTRGYVSLLHLLSLRLLFAQGNYGLRTPRSDRPKGRLSKIERTELLGHRSNVRARKVTRKEPVSTGKQGSLG